MALSLCLNHLVLLTFCQCRSAIPERSAKPISSIHHTVQYLIYVITHNFLIPKDGCKSAPSLMLWYIILFLSYHDHSLKSADSNLVVKNKHYSVMVPPFIRSYPSITYYTYAITSTGNNTCIIFILFKLSTRWEHALQYNLYKEFAKKFFLLLFFPFKMFSSTQTCLRTSLLGKKEAYNDTNLLI